LGITNPLSLLLKEWSSAPKHPSTATQSFKEHNGEDPQYHTRPTTIADSSSAEDGGTIITLQEKTCCNPIHLYCPSCLNWSFLADMKAENLFRDCVLFYIIFNVIDVRGMPFIHIR
jgi:hypothetical protein